MSVLALNQQGQPQRWINHDHAVTYHAKNLIAFEIGEDRVTYRGGVNSLTNTQSTISTAAIIAIKGESSRHSSRIPVLSNAALFRRDNYRCAYCGRQFVYAKLSRDHIIPTSRGGRDDWKNTITACLSCNNQKDDRLLCESKLELLFIPYVPTTAESLLSTSHEILACQRDYLRSFLPKHSRCLNLV